MKRTFYIRTYGCQMNERDSEALGCLLQEQGWQPAQTEETADLLLFNTCSVREQAERKAIGKVGFMKRLKKKNPDLVIGIIGCMAQSKGEALLEQLPHVDLVVGTDRIHELPSLIRQVLEARGAVGTHLEDRPDNGKGERPASNIQHPTPKSRKKVTKAPALQRYEGVGSSLRVVRTGTGPEVLGALQQHQYGRVTSFVSVMRGCNQFCTYCIVPYVRGREKSRPIDDIVAEIEDVVAHGTREIFLLGQNVTAYGLAELREQGGYSGDESPFADLLAAVNEVPGVERIRFTSPHPKYMNRAFIDAIASLPKVCEAFHIPMQSGSDRILKAMKRGYSAADYMDRIRRIKDRLPAATFSTDVIVGFPGEADEDFLATREMMETVGFDMAYVFKYSPRSGTKAAGWPDDVPREVKEARNHALLADLEKRTARTNEKYLGQSVEVLVEGESKRNAARWTGRTRANKVCIFSPTSELSPGQLVHVRIERVTPNSLFGSVISDQ